MAVPVKYSSGKVNSLIPLITLFCWKIVNYVVSDFPPWPGLELTLRGTIRAPKLNHRSLLWPKHNSCRKRVCRNVRFLNGYLSVSYRSWDKSKNPGLCRYCIFPHSVHHQNLGNTQPVASCFPGPGDAPHWEMCNFCIGMGSCYRVAGWF